MCGKDNKLLSCMDDLHEQTYSSCYHCNFLTRKLGFPKCELRGNCNRLISSSITKIAVGQCQRLFYKEKTICFLYILNFIPV